MVKRLSLTALFLLVALTSPRTQTPDFGGYRPHLQGGGYDTVGGRGIIGTTATPKICAVNRIDDPASPTLVTVGGAGNPDYRSSFRGCLNLINGPRFILFEVSGVIAGLNGNPFTTTIPYVTVAGQTAPSPGILIKDASLNFATSQAVAQHFRVRRGRYACYSTCGDSAIRMSYTGYGIGHHYILDHMSASWGTSTVTYSSQGSNDVMVVDSIIGEGIANPNVLSQFTVPTFLFYSSTNFRGTIARNLFANTGNRNPMLSPNEHVAHYNNVAYNTACSGANGTLGNPTPCYNQWPYGFAMIGGNDASYVSGPMDLVSVDNAYIRGPNTASDAPVWRIALGADQLPSTVYLARNSLQGVIAADLWSAAQVYFCPSPVTCGSGHGGPSATVATVKSTVLPSWWTAYNFVVRTNTGGNVIRDFVLDNAGARPHDRDAVDTQIVNDVINLTGASHGGFYFNDENQAGGYPTGAGWTTPNTRTLTGQIPTNPFGDGTCGTTTAGPARTRLECWLESDPVFGAQALEGTSPLPSIPVVNITTPVASGAQYETTSSALTTLTGTSSTATGTITGCTWTNTIGGSGSGSTTGTTSWSVASITLTANVVNHITVTCTNSSSNSTSAFINVLYVPTPGTITDAFTRSDWSTLGPSWVGQTGTVRATVSNNQAVSISASEANERFSAVAPANNQCAQATIKVISAGKTVGVKVRASGADSTRNEYNVFTDGTSPAQYGKVINGSGSIVGSAATTFVGGDVIKLCVTSQSLQLYRNGVAVGTAVTVTSPTLASGSAGMLLAGVGVTLDDFSGTSSADVTPPTIAITAPSSTGTYTASATPLTTLAGTAADNVGVTSVTWTNSAGGSGAATGTTSWSVASITLTAGTNNITVTAHDAAGNTTPAVLSVNYIPPTPTTPPIVTITSFADNYETGSTPLTNLAGTSFSSGGTISSCSWSNTVGGSGSGIATGTTSWSVSSISMTANVINRLIVACVDNLAQSGTAQRDVLYVPPVSSASDSFARVNWPTLGPNWTTQGSYPMRVVSNAAYGQTASVDHYAAFTGWGLNANQCSQATITALTSGKVGVLVRASGGNAYLLTTDGTSGSGHTYIARVISGSQTSLGAISTTFSNGNTMKLCVTNSSLQAYKNGTAVGGAVTDTALTSGSAGVYAYNTTAAVDSFVGSNASGTTVNNKNPIADPGGPYTGTANTAVKVDASHSIAKRGVIKRYTWSWGDGTADSAVTTPITTHTFTSAGSYTITLIVRDSRNKDSLPVSTTVTVS